jgi:hypothetical protein
MSRKNNTQRNLREGYDPDSCKRVLKCNNNNNNNNTFRKISITVFTYVRHVIQYIAVVQGDLTRKGKSSVTCSGFEYTGKATAPAIQAIGGLGVPFLIYSAARFYMTCTTVKKKGHGVHER